MKQAPVIVEFRFAQSDETGALEELQRRTALASRYREEIIAHPDAIEIPVAAVAGRCARVATCGGQIIAFSLVVPAGHGVSELDGLFVEPEYQRRGVGRRLLEDVFAVAREQGVRRMEVTSNLEAVEFYEKIGFVRDGAVATRFAPALRMHIKIAPLQF